MADHDADAPPTRPDADRGPDRPTRPDPPDASDLPTDAWIALLLPVVAALPMLVELDVSVQGIGLVMTALVASILFAILRVHQGYAWDALRLPMGMALALFLLAVPVMIGAPEWALVLAVAAVVLSLVALWSVYAADAPLPHLVFIAVAIMVGGALLGVVDNAVVAVAALVLVFAWPLGGAAAGAGAGA